MQLEKANGSEDMNPRLSTNPKKDVFAKNRRILAVVITVLSLPLAFGLGVFVAKQSNNPAQQVVFRVNGEEYTREELETLLTYPISKGSSYDDSAKKAFEFYKVLSVADSMGVSVSDEDVESAKKALLQQEPSEQAKQDPWINLASKAQAINLKISKDNPSALQGYSMVFWFGQKIEKSPESVRALPDGFGDAQKIEEDKQYAKQRADYYYEQLKNGAITPEQVIEAIKQDHRISYNPDTGYTFSTQFGTKSDISWRNQVFYQDIKDFLATDAKQGLNEVRLGKTGVNGNQDDTETYYYIVSLDKGSPSDVNAAKTFAESVKNLKAQYYGW